MSYLKSCWSYQYRISTFASFVYLHHLTRGTAVSPQEAAHIVPLTSHDIFGKDSLKMSQETLEDEERLLRSSHAGIVHVWSSLKVFTRI